MLRKLIFIYGHILHNKEIKTMSERCKKLIEKHKNALENNYFLPIFLESLVEGGIEFFDELREYFEEAGIDLKEGDFTRLK